MATPQPPTADLLRDELEYFEQIKAELLKHHMGKFALVKGRELVGTYTKNEEAYEEGVKRFGNVPMLIKLVATEEPVEQIPALMHGLLNAHP
jgi:hypothetical protein